MEDLSFKRIKLKEPNMWCDIIPDPEDDTVSNFYIYNNEYQEMMFCFGISKQDVRMFIFKEDILEEILSGYITQYYKTYAEE